MRGARLWSEYLLSRGVLPNPTVRRTPAPTLRSFITSSPASVRPSIQHGNLAKGTGFILRTERPTVARQFRFLRFKSDKTSPSQNPNPTPHLGSPEPALSLSQRLRKLSREYGWAAFGVYMTLTALDFPFCFLAVRSLGTDRIGHYEHVVVESFKNVVRLAVPDFGKNQEKEHAGASAGSEIAEATAREGAPGLAGGIAHADAENSGADACTHSLKDFGMMG